MRMHRPVAEKVISALQQSFGEGYYVDKVLERMFKGNKQLGSRDRKFIAESVFDIVRWWRLLWASLDVTDEPSLETRDLGHLLGAWLVLKGGNSTLPEWPMFRGLDPERIRRSAAKASKRAAIRESIPDWLYDLGSGELGKDWDRALAALNQQAPVVLRANRLRVSREELAESLKSDEIETELAADAPDGLRLIERSNIFTSAAFKSGLFEMQDGASQQVAPLLAPKAGDRVIDACAGAGGKALHLAALMKNKGTIIAMDVSERKLGELRKRSSRNGVDIIETRVIEGTKTIKRLAQKADCLLLDVPCSGLGVLRRNPDSKWKLSIEEIERLRGLQAEILDSYSTMVKPGGRMVYATCSILPSENGDQVRGFLEAHPEWKLVEEKRFWPGEKGYDGFYAALLTRK